jgi:transposase-like protein
MANDELNLIALAQHFSDDDKAREFVEKLRWPDGPVCPHCGEVNNAYKLEPKPAKENSKGKHVRKGVWKCGGCREQFTVTVGTIFEDSHIPLSKWLLAYHLLCASKKGMSAHQLHRMLTVTYRSAWFMAHRIRYTMSQEPLSSKLTGIIEVDETYVGGKPRKQHGQPKAKRGRGTKKVPVVALVERGGRVRAHKIEHVNAKTLKGAILENVDRSSAIMTDEWRSYHGIGKEFAGGHHVVNHGRGEYVRGDASTNEAEAFFALLKRGIVGSFHHVSKKHLDRYCDEFSFRWNHRKTTDSERTVEAIKGAEGKRLMYREPIGK